ncbi:hypothetical protein KIPB_004128, partial [Kipferlia bialata]
DIGQVGDHSWERAVQAAASVYAHVVVVPGNHEYYRVQGEKELGMAECDARMEDVCASLPNVHLLNKTSVVIEGVRFSGCTLWSALGEDSHAPHFLRDFEAIPDFDKRIHTREGTAQAYLAVHNEHRAYIESVLSEPPSTPTHPHVVVTHHGPLLAMNTKESVYNLSDGFVSDLSGIINSDRVCLWVSGHTHQRIQTRCNGSLSISNCHGYPGYQDTRGYQSVVVEVPSPEEEWLDTIDPSAPRAECVTWYPDKSEEDMPISIVSSLSVGEVEKGSRCSLV